MTKLEARLVRTDFQGDSTIICKIFSDSEEIGTLQSVDYNDNINCLLLPVKETIKIIVYSNDQVFGSVSFSVSLLSDSGCVWLPVISDQSNDFIEELPEELSYPKILMFFERKQEETSKPVDELIKTREELKILTKDYQDLVRNSKQRELALIKSLEEKENEIRDYIQQLSKAQSRIFTLLSEKKHLNENLLKIKQELSFNTVKELREELEISRQELFKYEKRNEILMQKLEDVHNEWNFIEEESKHYKETELISQINQLKNEVEIKNKEISLLKSQASAASANVLNEISNKPVVSLKFSKPKKEITQNCTVLEGLQNSMNDDDSILQRSYFVSSTKAINSCLKENFRKTPEPERVKLPKSGTLNSSSKTKFIPVNTSRRLHSVERKCGK